ncbi:hypothetical protein J5500_00930 [Candidatus Saccharibacteria bacterium]|nr:hypothetical protein [Candidatus Saccharibacteria bacterium]
MGRIFMGYWDCGYCGTNNIGGDKMQCPNCGKARGKDVVFHPNPTNNKQPRRYISEGSDEYRRAKSGPDWTCEYCDSNNPATTRICRNCGHSRDRDDKNYYEHHPERSSIIPPIIPATAAEKTRWESQYSDDSSSSNDSEEDEDEEDYHHQSDKKSYSPFTSPNRPSFHFNIGDLPWNKIGIGLLIVAAIIGLIMIFVPKERYITVTGVDWQRNIVVEEYRTVRESDWSVPSGGRTVYTQREIHHYDHVIDHYDKVRHERTVVVGSHEEVVGYRDLGNGYFEEQTRTVYDYDTEVYYTDEAVYRDDPVYRTKYYYDIERWVYDHTVKASANDKEPYWPEVKLADNQRANGRSESYGITALYKDKESHYTLDYKDWSDISIGSELHVKVHVGGHIELIYE